MNKIVAFQNGIIINYYILIISIFLLTNSSIVYHCGTVSVNTDGQAGMVDGHIRDKRYLNLCL